MTDDLVKAAREALAGVTEGPWHVTERGDYWVKTADTARGVALCGAMEWSHADTRQIEWENTARFIAAARSLVPAMADRIEALEAENAKFIATARSLVPAMADRIEALEAENAKFIATARSLVPAMADRIVAQEAEIARLRNLMQLHHAIDDLASQQQPLGAEFEAVLEAHLDGLYER